MSIEIIGEDLMEFEEVLRKKKNNYHDSLF